MVQVLCSTYSLMTSLSLSSRSLVFFPFPFDARFKPDNKLSLFLFFWLPLVMPFVDFVIAPPSLTLERSLPMRRAMQFAGTPSPESVV